jgi:4-hydroxy-4-methyl-2-oxoglutarate aldolase
MDVVRPGDVLVIATGGAPYACWGEMMSLAAKAQGVAGVIVDGPLTDVAQQMDIGLPVFGKGRAALTTQVLGEGGSINLPVVCGGLHVDPGDLVLGSADGVLVLPKREAEHLYDRACDEEKGDGGWREALLSGKRPSELYDLDGLIAGGGT